VERQQVDSVGDHPRNFLVVLRHLLRTDKMRLSDPSIVMMAMSSFAAFAYSIKAIANGFVRYREAGRKVSDASTIAVSDERMARLESAVEAIANEVERISEGQRFTTRLLTEQAQPIQAMLPRPGKFDTPH
jgi:phosphosulfolactate synthase (CoM biosynthesis protein A)